MKTLVRIALAVMAVACLTASASATVYTFNVADGTWDVPWNWNPWGPPDGDDEAQIPDWCQCRIENADAEIQTLVIDGRLVLRNNWALTIHPVGWVNLRVNAPGVLAFQDYAILRTTAALTIDGTGTVQTESGGHATIEGWGAQDYHWLYVESGVKMVGSIQFVIHVYTDALMGVDDPSHDMLFGEITPPPPMQYVVIEGHGTLYAGAGRIRLACSIAVDPGPLNFGVWNGTLVLTEYAEPNAWAESNAHFTVDGGTLQLDQTLRTYGDLYFRGGRIVVAPQKTAIFSRD